MKKKIVIINGHPCKESFCNELALSYKKGVENADVDCTLLRLIDLNFNPILSCGYKQQTPLELDLLEAQKELLEAAHITFVYPNWWATYPALLKGFIDRVFLPGFAFKYREDSLLWDKQLKGKSAQLIVTMDTPAWYYNLVLQKPGHRSMKKNILNFCGIRPVKITTLSPIKKSSEAKRKRWLQKIEQKGYKQGIKLNNLTK